MAHAGKGESVAEPEPLQVAFFGGSFDPPHFGHVFAAAYARGAGFERVLVVPVRSHAFGKQLADYEHRVAMTRLAFADIRGVEVSEIEAELPEPNFTLDTLLALTARHPHWQMRLMVGTDVLHEASKWKRFDEVSRLAPPFVLGRKGVLGEEDPGLELPLVSSTDVRKALERRGDPAALAWLERRVPRAVLQYVERERLYT